MGRKGLLALCVVALVVGLGWAVTSEKPVLVLLLVVGVVGVLAALIVSVTAKREGN